MIKCEHRMPTGSFKVRGALFSILRMTDNGGVRGVVAHSSGNFGLAVAFAASRMGIPAVIVVPHMISARKAASLRAAGVDMVITEPDRLDDLARQICVSHDYAFVEGDAPDVIAGHGTVGLEIAEHCPDVNIVYVPVGTGGLLAGIGLAMAFVGLSPLLVGVEPELAADATASFQAGRLLSWPTAETYRTAADGLRVPRLGIHAWSYIRQHVHSMQVVTEEEIVRAARFLANRCDVMAEPSGAVAVAAALRDGVGDHSERRVAVMSGGNVEPAWSRLLAVDT